MNEPISDAQAKAIAATANLGSDLVKVVEKGGGYLADASGSLVPDLFGYLIGDKLKHKRIRQWVDLEEEMRQILQLRNVLEPFEEVSPSFALPFFQAAVDDTREHLRALWAKLLASAMDGSRKRYVRRSFINIIQNLEPLDVLLFPKMDPPQSYPNLAVHFATVSDVSENEVHVALQNLIDLGLINTNNGKTSGNKPYLTATGKVFLAAIAD